MKCLWDKIDDQDFLQPEHMKPIADLTTVDVSMLAVTVTFLRNSVYAAALTLGVSTATYEASCCSMTRECSMLGEKHKIATLDCLEGIFLSSDVTNFASMCKMAKLGAIDRLNCIESVV